MNEKYLLWWVNELIYDGQLKLLVIDVVGNVWDMRVGSNGLWWASRLDVVYDLLTRIHLSVILIWRYFRLDLWCSTGLVESFGRVKTFFPKFLLPCMKLGLCWKLLDRPQDSSSSLFQNTRTSLYLRDE